MNRTTHFGAGSHDLGHGALETMFASVILFAVVVALLLVVTYPVAAAVVAAGLVGGGILTA